MEVPEVVKVFVDCASTAEYKGPLSFLNKTLIEFAEDLPPGIVGGDAPLLNLKGLTTALFANDLKKGAVNLRAVLNDVSKDLLGLNAALDGAVNGTITLDGELAQITTLQAKQLSHDLIAVRLVISSLGTIVDVIDCSAIRDIVADTKGKLCTDTKKGLQKQFIALLATFFAVTVSFYFVTIAYHVVPVVKRHYISPFPRSTRHFRFPASWRAHWRSGSSLLHQHLSGYTDSLAGSDLTSRVEASFGEDAGRVVSEVLWATRAAMAEELGRGALELHVDLLKAMMLTMNQASSNETRSYFGDWSLPFDRGEAMSKSEFDGMCGASPSLMEGVIAVDVEMIPKEGSSASILALKQLQALQLGLVGQVEGLGMVEDDPYETSRWVTATYSSIACYLPCQSVVGIFLFIQISDVIGHATRVTHDDLINTVIPVMIMCAAIDIVGCLLCLYGMRQYLESPFASLCLITSFCIYIVAFAGHMYAGTVVGTNFHSCVDPSHKLTCDLGTQSALALTILQIVFNGFSELVIFLCAIYCFAYGGSLASANGADGLYLIELLQGDYEHVMQHSVVENTTETWSWWHKQEKRRGRPVVLQYTATEWLGKLLMAFVALLFIVGVGVAVAGATLGWFEPSIGAPPPNTLCNGLVELCDRRVNETVFPCTHNAMSSAAKCKSSVRIDVTTGQLVETHCSSQDPNFVAPNNYWNSFQQLDHGVRAMMIDLYGERAPNGGGPCTQLSCLYLCHGSCALGKIHYTTWLSQFKRWLDDHPREVIVLFIEQYVTNDLGAAAISAANLTNYTHSQARITASNGLAWPTLGELIANNRRLMVFQDVGPVLANSYTPVPPFYMWERYFAAQTPYSYQERSQMNSCARKTGMRGVGSLLVLNQFLTNPVAMPMLASDVNVESFIMQRVKQCEDKQGQRPNFVCVDFSSIGTYYQAINTINKKPLHRYGSCSKKVAAAATCDLNACSNSEKYCDCTAPADPSLAWMCGHALRL